MSQISRKLLGSLTQDYLWMRTLTNQSDTKLTEKLTACTKGFQVAAGTPVSSASTSASSSASSFAPIAQRGGRGGASTTARGVSSANLRPNARTQEWNKAVNHLTDIAAEQLAETTLLGTKKHIFS